MTTSPTPGQAGVRPNRSRGFALLVLLLGVGLGAAITGVVFLAGDDDSPGGSSAAQLSQVQASCRDWMDSPRGESLSDDQWCTDMFAWMSDQSGGSMMGSTMWQGPDQMGASCREWVNQEGADAGASARQECTDMVDWMNEHMSSRGRSWMMQDR